MLKVVERTPAGEERSALLPLDEIARTGARQMLMAALEAEAADYVERRRPERDPAGQALVVRNGRARKLTLGAGTVELRAPRINDRRRDAEGRRQRFTSRILPPYMRRSPKVAEVLPILYLRGLSTGDFRPALEGLLGEDAAGLSPTNIARLTACWEKEYTAFRQRSLEGHEYVYVWVDGVHFNIRLEDDRLCTLVMIGARPNGEKELLAVEDGYRESAESWKALLRDLKRRGLAAPAVAVGDGALGFWAAVREVWPESREQACWCHKLANVLDHLPPTASAPRQARAARNDVRRVPRRVRGRKIAFRGGVSGQVPQGGGVAGGQLGAPGDLLQLPGRTLEAPAHHQRDRVAVCHRAAARAGDQGRRFKNQGAADGLQAARHDPAALAAPRWRSSVAAGARRREVRGWSWRGSTEELYSLK
jgi:transposase-like protein